MEQAGRHRADFVARGSRSRLLLFITISLGVVASGLWSFEAFGPAPPEKLSRDFEYMVAAGVMTVVFGGLSLLYLPRLFQPPDELRVGTQGVYWSRWSNELIPWSKITRVAVRNFRRQHHFVLHLRDQEAYASHGMLRIADRINRLTSGGRILISMAFFDRRYEDALSAFETFCPSGVMFQKSGLKPDDGHS